MLLTKRYLAVLTTVLVFCVLMGISCTYTVASGPAVTKDYNFTDFTAVQAGSGFNVDIIQSDSYKVSVTVAESLVKYLDVTQAGQTVKIKLNLNGYTGDRPKATVSMPNLYVIDFSGGSSGNISGFKSAHDTSVVSSGGSSVSLNMESGNTTFDVSGGSRATGKINFADATLDASGGSRIELTGSGNNVTSMNASGGSQVIIPNLALQNARVTISGGSRSELNVNGKFSVDLSGGSILIYSGNPQLENVNVSGGSTLTKR